LKSRQPKKELAGKRGGRPQASRVERQGDTYRHKRKKVERKLSDAAVCPGCRAIHRNGRWRWSRAAKPTGAPTLCPACQRIRDAYPAGEVRIRGPFALSHRREIVGRIKSLEAQEKAEHPLNRLMEIRDAGSEIVVTTTDVHLAHAIGTALFDAYRGTLHAPWVEKGELLRLSWER
jgi:hypothetical protein